MQRSANCNNPKDIPKNKTWLVKKNTCERCSDEEVSAWHGCGKEGTSGNAGRTTAKKRGRFSKKGGTVEEEGE